MRHKKHTFKVGRTGSHKRCMLANLVKSLIDKERIETTIAKAKELRRHAEFAITLAKKDTLASRRRAISSLMISYNELTCKQKRKAKAGDISSYNVDRKIINKLFGILKDRYKDRAGGYTRIINKSFRVGDSAPTCFIEYVQ